MPLFIDTLNVGVTPEGITDFIQERQANANSLIVYDPQKVKDAFREFGRVTGGIGKAVKKPTASSVALAAGQLSSLVAGGIGAFYRFNLNPQEISVDEAKLDNIINTKAGHDINHWDHDDVIKIRYSGVSGTLLPPPEALRQGVKDIRFSAAWRRFEQFKRFWRAARRDIVIIWDGVYYRGSMKTFNHKRSASGPWLLSYSFDFHALPAHTRDLFGKDVSVATLIGLSQSAIRKLSE